MVMIFGPPFRFLKSWHYSGNHICFRKQVSKITVPCSCRIRCFRNGCSIIYIQSVFGINVFIIYSILTTSELLFIIGIVFSSTWWYFH